MVKSMTGYGSASVEDEMMTVRVEVKSLNSKFFDPQIKCPRLVSDREMEIRNMVSERLQRGKIMVTIDVALENGASPDLKFNTTLFNTYYKQLKGLADANDDPGKDIFRSVMQLPDVMVAHDTDKIGEKNWEKIESVISEALQKCDDFRAREGSELKEKLGDYVEEINKLLSKVSVLEKERSLSIRERLEKGLTAIIEEDNIDKNRYEQEIIFYLEKLDITEEMVRLKSHLDHFREVLGHKAGQGKKLGFIAQEIGREINTIGSKANDAAVQREVVQMKEELEKIKEQSLNLL